MLDKHASSPEEVSGFEVKVFVNNQDLTKAGAGMGMDPYEVVIPENRFNATATPQRIPFARCGCGVYGCGVTDVTIWRDVANNVVHWDWHGKEPLSRGVTFPADTYDDIKVERLLDDLEWETPERAVGRIILQKANRDLLRKNELTIDYVDKAADATLHLFVSLLYARSYQVFLRIPWENHDPQELAAIAVRLLAEKPQSWNAEWHSINRSDTPPPIAGPAWKKHRFTCP